MNLTVSSHSKGRFAIVTNVGMRCGGRDRRFDESAALRTAKSCGPDAPTLASSFVGNYFREATVAIKPGHRGEREGTR